MLAVMKSPSPKRKRPPLCDLSNANFLNNICLFLVRKSTLADLKLVVIISITYCYINQSVLNIEAPIHTRSLSFLFLGPKFATLCFQEFTTLLLPDEVRHNCSSFF